MWNEGERNGHAFDVNQAARVEILSALGMSERGIARDLGRGRHGVRTHLRGGNAFRDARWRVRRMRLRVLNEETNEYTVGHIGEIVDKGIQPVYCVTLADGKQLSLTENHRATDHRGLANDEGSRRPVRRRPRGRRYSGMRVDDERRARVSQPRLDGSPPTQRRVRCGDRQGSRMQSPYRAQMARPSRAAVHARGTSRAGAVEQGAARLHDAVVSERHAQASDSAARSGKRSNFWRGGISAERASIGRWTTEQAPPFMLATTTPVSRVVYVAAGSTPTTSRLCGLIRRLPEIDELDHAVP